MVVLAGCQQATTQPEETTVEVTTEETVPEKTVVIERTVEAASEPEPETPQVPVAAPAPSPVPPPPAAVPPASPVPAQVSVSQPDLQGAAVEEPVQPHDNEPSVTGVPCAVWTCRDEFGRTNADIQREFLEERQAAIDEAWSIRNAPPEPPLKDAAKKAFEAGDKTAGG